MKSNTQSLFDVFEVKGDTGNDYVAVPVKRGSRSNPPTNAIRGLGLVKGADDEHEAIRIAVEGERILETSEHDSALLASGE